MRIKLKHGKHLTIHLFPLIPHILASVFIGYKLGMDWGVIAFLVIWVIMPFTEDK